MKSDRRTFAEIGIEWKCKRLFQLVLGRIVGVIMNAVISFLLSLFFHFKWQLNPDFNIGVILIGLFLNCWSAIAEELIYRGYAFNKAINNYGQWKSIALFISLFAIIHIFAWGAWGDPLKMLSVFCTTGLGGLLFSIAFIKTKSIALPSGLHIGFIWANADFFTGMFARWYNNKQGLFIPVDTTYYDKFSQHGWLIINLPYFIVLLLTIFILSKVKKEVQPPIE